MKYIFPGIISLVIIFLCLVNYKLYQKVKTVAYVDAAYIYNNFKMKEELEKDFMKINEFKKQQLDSIYDVFKTLQQSGNDEKINMIGKEYQYKKDVVIEEQQRLKSSFDSQIWNQLNELIKEYGEQNKIDLILGANGQGAVMHGVESLNISKEFVEFANTKYNGK